MRSLTQQPFRTAVLVLVWGWLLFLVLTPNLLVVGASVMTRDPGSFISLPLTLDASGNCSIRCTWKCSCTPCIWRP